MNAKTTRTPFITSALLFVMVPLVLGALSYGMRPLFIGLKPGLGSLSDFLAYQLADLLWAMSLSSALMLIWQPVTWKSKLSIIWVAFITGVCWELYQTRTWHPLFMDFADIAAMSAGNMCAILFYKWRSS